MSLSPVAPPQAQSALSWAEVREICGEMEKIYRRDAQKDAQRLRALLQKRKQISAAVESKQSESAKQLQHLLANLKEWEEHEAAARARHEQVQMKIQELESLKRDIGAQLERLREDEQYPPSRSRVWGRLRSTSSKETLAKLLDKYEETRVQVAQHALQHQNDIPFAKHQMSLYASVTGIKWDFSGATVAGDIIVPAKQLVTRFEIDPATERFAAANALWDQIDDAFEDIDGSL
ncbi:hypothetical protein PybrP1_009196 [[Pythium] brassicae (nom. inval.)]|nr:hypothetical protein PybrP1_009196 [[Pythium] brassicae (nom. inval.)]